MKKVVISLIFLMMLSVASAEIIITQQPREVYNLDDSFSIPVTITGNVGASLKTFLSCEGKEILISQTGIISEIEEIKIPVPLTKENINELSGACYLRFSIRDKNEKTNEFKVSDLIYIDLTSEKSEVAPEENVILEGQATKENGEPVSGFAKLKIIGENSSVTEMLDTVKNGYFSINFSFPKETKADSQLISLEVYEQDINEKLTNKGFTDYNLRVTQVPTTLEIILGNKEVEPGTNVNVKIILHDQTGEPIETSSIITIKNNKNEILEQTEVPTGNLLEYSINYNEPPAEWKVFAVSNKLTSESTFKINRKESADLILVNRTIQIVNTGNVEYCNRSILVKIGEQTIDVPVCLDVDESEEYVLTAPEGEYEVKIISNGEERISKSVMLTGKAVDVKISKKSFMRHPLVWIFIIAILGFVAFILFKKGYKKNFFGYISKKKEKEGSPLKKGSLVNSKNKAEISLSIKGDKQNVSLVCLKLKNLKEIESQKGNAEETLQKIIGFAEERKAATYENHDSIFLILAPVKTKTFSNEKTAIEIAEKAKEILAEHNKLFKQKIEFGISVNYGTIVAKQEKDILKFMSMGTLITLAKKIASISKEEVLLSEKARERLKSGVKAEKQKHGNTIVYTIKEIKNRDEHKTFLSNFIKRLERDKKEKEESQ